jgi:hypothetical protein
MELSAGELGEALSIDLALREVELYPTRGGINAQGRELMLRTRLCIASLGLDKNVFGYHWPV